MKSIWHTEAIGGGLVGRGKKRRLAQFVPALVLVTPGAQPGSIISSVVQWIPFSFSFFWMAAPRKMVFPKKGSRFSKGH